MKATPIERPVETINSDKYLNLPQRDICGTAKVCLTVECWYLLRSNLSMHNRAASVEKLRGVYWRQVLCSNKYVMARVV